MYLVSHNEKQTIKIAKDLSKRLQGGEIILLYGDLGAGKTVFVKGLAKALGVKEIVKSPTFNILKCYSILSKSYKLKAKSSLCHIDAYRLESLDDLLDIGFEEYINNKNIIVIEWAERVNGIEKLTDKIIEIKMDHGKKEQERNIIIE